MVVVRSLFRHLKSDQLAEECDTVEGTESLLFPHYSAWQSGKPCELIRALQPTRLRSDGEYLVGGFGGYEESKLFRGFG